MAEFKLGRLRFVWQGVWTTGHDYVKDDIVRYGGSSFVCVGAHTSASDFYTNYDAGKWQLMTSGLQWQTTPWTTGTYYPEGSVVRYGGKIYISIDGHQASSSFDTDFAGSKWELFVDGVEWKTSTWTASGTLYKTGDLVRYGGRVYICIVGHNSSGVFEDDINGGNWQLFADGVQWKTSPWTASTYYKVSDIVRYGGKTYVCINEHSASSTQNGGFYTDLGTNQWQLFADGFAWLGTWTTGTYYKQGDVARYGGKSFVCVTGHTAASDFYTDLDATRWNLLNDGQQWITSVWTGGQWYKEGDLIRHGGKVYICIDGHTATNSTLGFNTDLAANKWQLFSDGIQWKGAWVTATVYKLGDVVSYGGRSYTAIVAHTAASDFYTDVDAARWELVADGVEWKDQPWSTSTLYKEGDIVRYGGKTFVCINGHTSDGNVKGGFYTDISNWQLFADGTEWLGNWHTNVYYKIGDIVRYNGFVYVCNLGHNSAMTDSSGLEADQGKWDSYSETFKFRQDWNVSTRYVVNDVVKFGGSLYICTSWHTSGSTFDETKWSVFVGGLQFEDTWSAVIEYQLGDVVTYGGYSYVAVDRNTGNIPPNEPTHWELLTVGFKVLGEWSDITSYKVGDLIHYGGNSYVAIANTTPGQEPVNPDGSDALQWQLVVGSFNWRNQWAVGTDYRVGDTVRWVANTYRCIIDHNSDENNSQPDLDITSTYWNLVVAGDENNVLAVRGDMLARGASENTRIPRGLEGQVLRMDGYDPQWSYFNQINKVYYVRTDGIDGEDRGTTLETAFASVKYATDFILADEANRAPATIFVKTGWFYEEGPIVIPANVAIVGDELRSTRIIAAPEKGIKSVTIENGGSGYSLRPYAEVLLTANRTFLQEEVIAWIDNNVTAATSYWNGFTYNSDYCYRDVGYIVDAITYDLQFGGNEKTIIAARRYWNGNVNKIAGQERQTIDALNRLRDVINNYIFTNTTYSTSQNSVTQTTNSNNAESNSTTRVTALMSIITTAINNGLKVIPSIQTASNPVTVVFDDPTAPNGQAAQGYAVVHNGAISSIVITKAGSGYVVTPQVTVIGTGSSALASCTLKDEAYAVSDFFYMRDGSGLRNCTLAGLSGTLSTADPYGTSRPTAGAYTSLDPGTGPGDENVWIVYRSPYVQNVTNFGDGCVGLKVDGLIHNGGNKTIVCNDYTQVLNDGIGIWATNQGRVENVSVFCYYNHIGYLAENGGVIRSTNGNSSYGTFGIAAEGVDPTEVSRTAKVDNRRLEAQIVNVLTDGDGIISVEYSNAGENYTVGATSYTWAGTGVLSSITGVTPVVRSNGVKEVRVMDSGTDWLSVVNNAQGGDNTYIRLSASDIQSTDAYVGERIVLTDGQGVGQYGYVTSFDGGTKAAFVAKESFSPLTVTACSSITNRFTTSSTSTLTANMPILFNGTTFGGVSAYILYYVKQVINSTDFTISTASGGSTFTPSSTTTGSMALHANGWETFDSRAVETVLDTTSRYTIEPRVLFTTGSSATATAAISKGINTFSISANGTNYQTAPDVVVTGTEINATGATATATISGSVSNIVVRNGGSGFTGTPSVQFIGGGGSSAQATAHVVTSIGTVEVTNRGTGYSVPPMVQISGTGYNGDGYVSANITGIVGEITITTGGTGYTSVPSVLVIGGGGTGATAQANLDAEVTGFNLIDGGTGYTSGTTTVTISRAAGDTTGAGASADAVVSNGVITGFTNIVAGSGYSKPPIVTITSSGVGVGASATAEIVGSIQSITILNGGSGYISTPDVSIVSNSGYGATANAITTNAVDSLSIIEGGTGFTGSVTLNIVGNSGFSYDEAKCSRDVGYLINAVATDMVFGSNGASVTAGLSYLRSYTSTVLSSQKSQTISAVAKVRDEMLSRTANTTARSRINTNFGYITDIINSGATSAPALSFPSPSNVDSGIIYAATLLQDNKAFLKAEIIAWIAYQVSTNTSPFTTSFYYDTGKCSRDVGYLIDAFTFDLLYGGNSQSLLAAKSYYNNGTSYVPGEGTQTVAAYTYLKSIVDDIILNNAITKSSGNAENQVTNAYNGSNAAVTAVQSYIDIVNDVVTDGVTTTTNIDPTFDNGNSTQKSIRTALIAATSDIQTNVIDYINLSFMGGAGATAIATTIKKIGYVTIDSAGSGFTSAPTVAISGGNGSGALATAYIDGAITSVTKAIPGSGYTTTPTVAFSGGKNFKSVVAGESYYKNTSSLIAISDLQQAETLNGINYIKTLIAAVGSNSDPATTYQTQLSRTSGTAAPAGAINESNFWVDVINAIIENGDDNSKAATIISDNKEFIASEVNAYISRQGYTSTVYSTPSNYSSAIFTTGQIVITTSNSGLAAALTALTVGKEFVGTEVGQSSNYTFTVSGTVTVNSTEYTIPVSNTTTGSHTISSITLYTGTGWTYTTADVKKRTRAIIDALIYDLSNGSVNRSIAIGQEYGLVAASESTAHNLLVLAELSSLANDVILNNVISAYNNDGNAQVFDSLITAELTAPTAITNTMNLISSLVSLSGVTGASGNSSFASSLVTNKKWIEAEVIEYIKITYPHFSYNQTLCARDVGLIVDAVAYDITNSASAKAVATVDTTNVLSTITVGTGGSGYGAATTVSFSGDTGTGSTPTATPVITNGVVTGFTITNAGSGYTVAPGVAINAGSGSGAFARAYVLGGLLKEIRMIHPGTGYTGAPYVSLVDPNNTTDATLLARVGSGVLDQPTFTTRGTGFVTASASVNGDGYADIYQVGDYLYVKNLTNIPTPGANVQFPGNTNFYKLVAIREIVGPTGIIGGKDLFAANKQFVQEQTIAYINATYPSLVYNQTLCKRDVGYIVDAMVSDVFGDTEKGIEAGRSYYRNASAIKAITNGIGSANAQKTATIAALDKILDYATSIVQNITVTRNQLVQLQVKEPLITTGIDAVTPFTTTINIIKDIINNGSTITGVSKLLSDNKLYIEAEVLAFIATTYPDFTYNETLCARDVGYIVDAVAYDLYGGVARSQDAGLRYYSSTSSLIAITTQKTETVAAINQISTLCQAIAQNQAPAVTYQASVARISDLDVTASYGNISKIATCVNTITNIINNGLSALPQGQYSARLQLNPPLDVTTVPADSVQLTVRSKYSQVRLTGHDFLNVGTGNKAESNYPGIPVNPVSQENEVIEGGGGRCFYTSTDQDGNFRVGELFKVEQATGVATLNASAFNLSGLNELSLGGITVGGTNVVIKEFSTDGTFLANSDNIVPTQKAIKTFISSQLGSGGGNLAVNAITAGDIQITGTEITTNAGLLTINSSGGTSITDTTQSSDKDTGALIVEGGVGVEKNLNVGGSVGVVGNLVVTGNITVNGSSGTLNTATLSVDDNNIELNAVSTPGDAGANGGGITLHGTTDKTILWASGTGYWTFNQPINATSIQNTPIGSSTRSTALFTTLGVNGQVSFTAGTSSGTTATGSVVVTGGVGVSENINAGGYISAISSISSNGVSNTGNLTSNGANATISFAPTGTGTVTINPATASNMNNMNIGATTRGTGAFTTLAANGAVTMTANTSSTDTTHGTLVVTGGVGVSENLNVGGNIVITGNLTVNGTTETINATTVTVDDINIELGSVASPTDTTANGGGITLKGSTDKTIIWDSANSNWTSSENWNIATGKSFKINNTVVLSATQVLGKTIGGTSSGDIVNLDTAQTLTNKTFTDSSTYFQDDGTPSKKMQFQLSGITTATTRTLTVQDKDGTISVLGDTFYVGTTSIANNRTTGNLGLTGITSIAMPGSTSGTVTLQPTATAGTTTITFPATTGTVSMVGDTFYIGTTSVANNRANASLALTGVSIDGNAGTVTNGVYTNSTFNLGTTSITLNRSSASQSLTGINIDGSSGSSPAGSLTGTTLASGVTASSLTSVGTLTSLTSSGTITGTTLLGTSISIAGNGASRDPYGGIAITYPADANNYNYHGSTRAGNIGAGHGITGTTGALGLGANAFWWGGSTSGAAGVLSGTAWMALNGSSLVISGTLTEQSSIKYKENVKPIVGALDKVLQLQGVTYDKKDGSAKGEPGLIAEDTLKVISEIVMLDQEGNAEGINYTKLTAYLVESIKELKAEIEVLKGNK